MPIRLKTNSLASFLVESSGLRRDDAVRRQALTAAGLIALVLYGIDVQPAYPNADVALPQYSVKSWTTKDVFMFGDTSAVAQGHDGYLWLGTRFGLVRFDGVEFTQWKVEGLPQNSPVTALRTARDGSLWVGRGAPAGVLRLQRNQVTHYTSRDGLPDGYVVAIVEDNEGTIWASTNRGISRFRDGRWDRMPGILSEPSRGLFVDRSGSVWVGGASGLIRVNTLTRKFDVLTSSSEIPAIAEDSHGGIWFTDPIHTVQGIAGNELLGDSSSVDMGAGVSLLADRRGNLWVGTAGQGLLRFRPTPRGRGPIVERFTTKDGLPSNTIRALLEDREGNIWVGTQGGLSRLSERTVITLLEGAAISAIATGQDKTRWVATADGVHRIFRGLRKDLRSRPVCRAISRRRSM
jgi:ligand-binding sensor domain-containing protein